MKSPFISCSWIAGYSFALLSAIAAPVGASQPVLQTATLTATGRQETLVTIPRFGRYAVKSKSEQGVAIRYINKMSGPSALSGIAGSEDGRLDAFWDIGNYKIVTYADEKGRGKVKLSVSPFTELNGDLAPVLVEHKLVSAELGDLQQRSYWINVKSRNTILLEAAGRSLADMRLWRDGNWLVDLIPVAERIEPSTGKPLMAQRLVADLTPGLYQLVAYGGEAQPWAESADEQPFHLRMGIPTIAANGLDHKVTSPFGYDRWLVPATTDYYRLELSKNSPAQLTVAQYNKRQAFSLPGRRSEITKKSRLPVAEVRTSKGRHDNYELVTVIAEAGQPYILQRFSARRRHDFSGPGKYWVSTLHSGFGEDSADATAILTDTYRKEKYIDSRTIALDGSQGWQRRFNILDKLTMYFEIKMPGSYRVEAEGIEGEYRFEPFVTFRDARYKVPKSNDLGESWELNRGFYILTVMPDNDAKGVATLSVYPVGRKPTKPSTAQTFARFTPVDIPNRHRYRVYMNRQPGVTSGLIVRKYPIDLRQSMPLTLMADEALELSVRIPSRGELAAKMEDGSYPGLHIKSNRSAAAIAAKGKENKYPVDAGLYKIKLHNANEHSAHYQLEFTQAGLLESSPLPLINPNLIHRPDFPVLQAQQPQFFDLKQREQKTFNVQVDEPGLYKLETTGLLETGGNIRTRVITELDKKVANGVGRNFLIQQYLREGDYQLSLAPQGKTKGHLGARLSKSSLIDGGELEDGIPARFTLPSGEGLRYVFEIKQAGQYRLESFGANGNFSVRLEDTDGWPLVKPGIQANFNRHFRAGKYHLVVLPMAMPSRVVSILQRVAKPPMRAGHGPFSMGLNQRSYSHTWLEPETGQQRLPDIWTFELPASAETTLSLTQGMEARLVMPGDSGTVETEPLKFSGSKPLTQRLRAGRYRIEASASRKNNRLDYSLRFATKEMVVGQKRQLTAPAEIDLSIGQTALIELSSLGRYDVKAKLFDADGKVLASNDDRANDWNFNIIRPLSVGQYRLSVLPVGQATAQTSISLSEPEALAEIPLTLPAEFSINNPLIHTYALDLSGQSGVFAAAVESRDSVSMTLEKRGENGFWRSIASSAGSQALLLVAIENSAEQGKHYRLKIWSPERRKVEVKVNTRMLETSTRSEGALAKGLQLSTESLFAESLIASRVQLKSPGLFKASANRQDSLLWAAAADRQLDYFDGFIGSADSETLWLVSRQPSIPLQAQRVVLQENPLSFNLPTGEAVWIDSVRKNNRYQLILAESRIGLPGVGVAQNSVIDARRMGVGLGSSLVLAPLGQHTGKLRVKLWNTGSDSVDLPVTLSRFSFAQPRAQKLNVGLNDARLRSQGALSLSIDASLYDLQFNLPQGMAAALLKDGVIQQGFWSDRRDESHQILTDADNLLLFNTRTNDRSLVIKVSHVEASMVLSRDNLFNRYFPQAGTFSIAVSGDNSVGSYINAYGDRVELLAQYRQGKVYRGQQVDLHDDGRLSISHGVGLVSAWINNKQVYQGDIAAKVQRLPAQIKLNGQTQDIAFKRDKPGFVHLQSATPMIVRIRRSGLGDLVQVFESGVNQQLFLPEGDSVLQLQATSAQTLNGNLQLSLIAEAELDEGLGEKVGLLPGEARLYQFSLPGERDIGIGVQASVDIARGYLFNQRGEQLGAGVSQKHRLAAGTYYLIIELPADAVSSIELRPAIVGIKSPDTGASKNTMLQYQKYSQPEALSTHDE